MPRQEVCDADATITFDEPVRAVGGYGTALETPLHLVARDEGGARVAETSVVGKERSFQLMSRAAGIKSVEIEGGRYGWTIDDLSFK